MGGTSSEEGFCEGGIGVEFIRVAANLLPTDGQIEGDGAFGG